MSHTSLHLFKENFKFSAGHFLIFDEKRAERLHGHNYQVFVDFQYPRLEAGNPRGFWVDFAELKRQIKAELDLWDECVLLPELHPDMLIQIRDGSLELRFRERRYLFPRNEVVLLPVTNTSVEQLSGLLAEKFCQLFSGTGLLSLEVRVEETPGQGASCWLEVPRVGS